MTADERTENEGGGPSGAAGADGGADPEPVRAKKVTPYKRHVADDFASPQSPFEQDGDMHGEVSELSLEKYSLLMRYTSSCVERFWVSHDVPIPLKITGKSLQQQLRKGGHLRADVITGYVRVIQQQDAMAFKKNKCTVVKWRHIMEPHFTEAALRGGEFRVTEAIRELVVGAHLAGLYEHSRMVMVPTNGTGYWALYVWDLQTRAVHVLDLVFSGPNWEMDELHGEHIKKIHIALVQVAIDLFEDWEDDFGGFHIQHKKLYYQPRARCESGICILHYMKWFSGEHVVRIINEEQAEKQRRAIMYDLISMTGNNGDIPAGVIEQVDLTE
ncbi:unnamed protein product [Urochloa decumbens]|uniref:Ubiquitin-like protease family profile domain-containing protein n=1 Tax=Urochloa decumbens TaxID=240449 RepID=A0ABC9DY45_9POAL